MQIKKTYAVFGLGRYGTAVARELVENGMEVIAVDARQQIVNEAAAYLPVCKCADVTDKEVIDRLGIAEIDTVIICMASNLESSVLATTLCKEIGVRNVVVKCGSEMHRKILLRVGADKVVFPENESGIRLAKNMLSAGVIDMLSLSEDVSVVEIAVKKEWVGKTLIDLNLRKKYGFNVVAIRRGECVNAEIDPAAALVADAALIVIANTAKLAKMR